MFYHIIERLYTIVGGRDPDDPDFEVSVQVCVIGDKAFMWSAHGAGFYKLMAEHGKTIIEQLKVRSIEAYVLPDHKRLMAIALRRHADVRALERGQMAGRDMIWVQITPWGMVVEDTGVTVDSGIARSRIEK